MRQGELQVAKNLTLAVPTAAREQHAT